jgi:TP901 family phage tail tape measure protein
MSDVQKTIEVLFRGVDNLSSTITTVGQKMGDFAGGVDAATAPLAKLANVALGTEAALAALAVAGLAVATSEAGKFGDAMNEVGTLVTDTSFSIDSFKDDVLDYAKSSTQSLESIETALYKAISAGISYSDSLDMLSTAEALAVATKSGLDQALLLLVSSMNAYGASTDEATAYSDALFTTVKVGQTTLPELSASLSQVTGIAAAAGIPFDTLTAALAGLTASGLPTSQAVTGLKAAISNIIQPSAEAAKAADELRIQFDAAALESKGFEGVMQELYVATGGNVTEMAKFFGSVEGLNAALILSKDSSGKFKVALDEMAASTGSTEIAFAKMAENMELANTKFINNVRVALIQFGEELVPLYTDLLSSISTLFAGLGAAVDQGAFDPLFEALTAFEAELSLWAKGVGDALPAALSKIDWTAFTASLADLSQEAKDLFEAIFGNLDLTDPDDLAKLIQQIIDGVTGLTNVVAGILDSWEPFVKGIHDMYVAFIELSPETQKAAGETLGFGQAINTIAGLVGDFGSAITGIGTALQVIAVSSAISTITGLGGAFTTASGFASSFGAALTAVVGSASAGGLAAGAGLLGLAGAAGYVTGTLANEYVPGVAGAAQSVAEFTDKILNWTNTQNDANAALEVEGRNLVEIKGYLDAIPADVQTKYFVSTADALADINSIMKNLDLVPDEIATRIMAALDQGDWETAIELMETYVPDEMHTEIRALVDESGFDLALDYLKNIPDEKVVEIYAETTGIDVAMDALAGIPEEELISIMFNPDEYSIDKSQLTIDQFMQYLMMEYGMSATDAGLLAEIYFDVDVDTETATKETKQLKKTMDEELGGSVYMVNLNTSGAMSSAKGAADAMVGMFNFEVGMDTTAAKDAAKSLSDAFSSSADIFTSTGDLMGDLLAGLSEAESSWERSEIWRLMEEENERRERALVEQEALTRAEIEYLAALTAQITRQENMTKSGYDPTIYIKAEGLEPHMEAFMWELLKQIQIRATENGAEFLLAAV